MVRRYRAAPEQTPTRHHTRTSRMEPLQVTRHDRDDRSVLVLVGALDVATAPGFRQTLQETQYGGGRRVVLDLGGLEFLDSFGLGVIIGGLRRARTHGGSLTLEVPTDSRVRHVFEVTGLDDLLGVASGPGDAAPGH
jgi:anti-sigma B factor antagonist